jgi:hypothetical protein
MYTADQDDAIKNSNLELKKEVSKAKKSFSNNFGAEVP